MAVQRNDSNPQENQKMKTIINVLEYHVCFVLGCEKTK